MREHDPPRPDDTQDQVHAEPGGPPPEAASRGPRRPPSSPVKAIRKAKLRAALFDEPMAAERIGRFTVIRTLGSGGMGIVLEAYDSSLDRRLAIKLLREGVSSRNTRRLEREAQALAKLSHPNVVQVYETGTADGQMFIAMELVRGQTLKQWQQQRHPWRECVELYLQAGRGLAAAHARGLVHRDFKPGNTIVDQDGRVRVLDFGLVHESNMPTDDGPPPVKLPRSESALREALTQPGAVLGTVAYMPPEQLQGQTTDHASDQFSFCVSLYEAIYGERPHAGRTAHELIQAVREGTLRPAPRGVSVPPRLRRALLRGLRTEPGERWSSMNALVAELESIARPRQLGWATLIIGAGLFSLGVGLWQRSGVEAPEPSRPPPAVTPKASPACGAASGTCEKLDVLFVIDNSGSMIDDNNLLASVLSAGLNLGFGDILTEGLCSYRIAVTTIEPSGIAQDPGCDVHGAFLRHGAHDPCFDVPEHPPWLDERDDLTALSCLLTSVGERYTDNERQMDTIFAALDPELLAPGACNAGFLRDDAALIIVLVTDEDDDDDGPGRRGSAGNPRDWLERLKAIKPLSNVGVVSIITMSTEGCEWTPSPRSCEGLEVVLYEGSDRTPQCDGQGAERPERIMRFMNEFNTERYGSHIAFGDICRPLSLQSSLEQFRRLVPAVCHDAVY